MPRSVHSVGDGGTAGREIAELRRMLRRNEQQLQLLKVMREADAAAVSRAELYHQVLPSLEAILEVASLTVVMHDGTPDGSGGQPAADHPSALTGEPGDGEPGDGEPDDGEPDDGEPDDGEPDDGEPFVTPGPPQPVEAPLRVGAHAWGTLLAVPVPERGPWSADDAELLQLAADRVALSIDRIEQAERLAQSEQSALQLVHRRLAHAETLERITARLSLAYTPVEVAEALRDVATLCRADHYVLLVHDPASALLTALVAFPLDSDLIVAPIDAPLPAGEVVITGRPKFFERGSDIDAAYPLLATTRRRVGDASVAIVPLAGLTEVLGAVMLGFTAPQQFDDRRRAELTEIGRRCGQAYERAQLLSGAEEAARRATQERRRAERALANGARLLRLADELRLDEPTAVAGPKVATAVATAVDATAIAIYEVAADNRRVRLIGQVGIPQDMIDAGSDESLSANLAGRIDIPTIYRSRDEIAGGMVGLLQFTDALGAQAALAIRLLDDTGQPVGVALAVLSEALSQDAEELRDFYTLVGREAAHALVRSRRADDRIIERRRADQLADFSDHMSRTVSYDDVHRVAAVAMQAAVGSSNTAYHWAGSSPRRIHLPSADALAPGRFERLTYEDDHPVVHLVQAAARSPEAYGETADGPFGPSRTLVVPLWDDHLHVGSLIVNPSPDTVVDVELVRAIGLRIVQTFARTRLYEAERTARISADEARRVNAALRDAAGALAGAPTFADISAAVFEHAAALLGATSAAIAVLAAHQPLLEVFTRVGAEGSARTLLRADADLPGPHAARSRQPLYFETAAEQRTAFPRATHDDYERGAAIFVPQESGGVGYVSIGFDHDRSIPIAERDLVAVFARLVFQAVERAALLEAEKQTARSFQQRLLDAPPFVHRDVTVATRYLAGADEVHIGGDWHDVLTLRDGRVLLVVGDVVGRGLLAATAMAQLRNAVRAFAQVEAGPASILTRLDAFVTDTAATTFATAAVVLLQPFDGTVRYALAGHLPPLVIGQHGIAWLGDGLGPPLGLCLKPSARHDAGGHLADGDQLVLYTDGLVERRGEPLQNSLDRFAAVAGPLRDTHPERLAATILDHAGPTSDDTALVIARIRRTEHPQFHLLLTSAPAGVRDARERIAAWLATSPLAAEEAHDLILAVSEVISNAIEHAHHFDPGLTVDVRGAMTPSGGLEITVSDQGVWRAPVQGTTTYRGRGLALARAVSSEMDVLYRGNGSTVILRYERPEPTRPEGPPRG